MTLEISPAPATTSAPAANDSPPAKTHGKHGKAAGGFMAILAAQGSAKGADTGATSGVDLTLQGLVADAKGKGSHGIGKHGLPGAGKGTDLGKATDAKTALDADAAKLLPATSTDGSVPTAGSAADAAMAALPEDTTALLAQSAQWSATAGATAAPLPESAKSGVPAASIGDTLAGAKAPHGVAKLDQPLVAEPVVDTGVATSARLAKAQKDAATRLAGVSAGTEIATQTNAAAQPDPKALQATPKIADLPMAAIATALAATGSVAPGRREDASRERSGFRTSASDSASVSQSYTPTGASNTASNGVDAPSPTDTFVAEKVAYWISNDVQNAQMKLDGIGDKPVEVSIRMQGNEAHVAFRTDELQTQAALENASQHLKDMLQREGLVLSGVSVGSSNAGGAGGAGDQQPGSRQGVRQAVVTSSTPAPTGADRGVGVTRATGRALDLFV